MRKISEYFWLRMNEPLRQCDSDHINQISIHHNWTSSYCDWNYKFNYKILICPFTIKIPINATIVDSFFQCIKKNSSSSHLLYHYSPVQCEIKSPRFLRSLTIVNRKLTFPTYIDTNLDSTLWSCAFTENKILLVYLFI